MTPEQTWRVVDGLQNRVHQLEALVDEMAAQMNAFTAEMREHIVTLLQQSGQDIKITNLGYSDPNVPDAGGTSSSTPDVGGTSSHIPEGEKK